MKLPMEPTNLQKAIAVAQKASQEDQAGNYQEAIKSYQHAVKYFLHIVKCQPQGKEGNQKIRDKCKLYLDRVEELQEYLEKREVGSQPTINPTEEEYKGCVKLTFWDVQLNGNGAVLNDQLKNGEELRNTVSMATAL